MEYGVTFRWFLLPPLISLKLTLFKLLLFTFNPLPDQFLQRHWLPRMSHTSLYGQLPYLLLWWWPLLETLLEFQRAGFLPAPGPHRGQQCFTTNLQSDSSYCPGLWQSPMWSAFPLTSATQVAVTVMSEKETSFTELLWLTEGPLARLYTQVWQQKRTFWAIAQVVKFLLCNSEDLRRLSWNPC